MGTGIPGTGLELQQAAGIRSIRTENMDKMVLKSFRFSFQLGNSVFFKKAGGRGCQKPHKLIQKTSGKTAKRLFLPVESYIVRHAFPCFQQLPLPAYPLLQKSPLGFRELQRKGESAHLWNKPIVTSRAHRRSSELCQDSAGIQQGCPETLAPGCPCCHRRPSEHRSELCL